MVVRKRSLQSLVRDACFVLMDSGSLAKDFAELKWDDKSKKKDTERLE